MNELNPTMEKVVDVMGKTYFDRFMIFADKEDLETSKAIMDEWIVDGEDPDDGEVEFIWLENND